MFTCFKITGSPEELAKIRNAIENGQLGNVSIVEEIPEYVGGTSLADFRDSGFISATTTSVLYYHNSIRSVAELKRAISSGQKLKLVGEKRHAEILTALEKWEAEENS